MNFMSDVHESPLQRISAFGAADAMSRLQRVHEVTSTSRSSKGPSEHQQADCRDPTARHRRTAHDLVQWAGRAGQPGRHRNNAGGGCHTPPPAAFNQLTGDGQEHPLCEGCSCIIANCCWLLASRTRFITHSSRLWLTANGLSLSIVLQVHSHHGAA